MRQGIGRITAMFDAHPLGGSMRRTVFAATLIALMATLGSAASAAPDRSVALSRNSLTASWTSEVNVGNYLYTSDLTRAYGCVQGCDETLIKVGVPGSLRVVVSKRGPLTSQDFYFLGVTLYGSDAAGGR